MRNYVKTNKLETRQFSSTMCVIPQCGKANKNMKLRHRLEKLHSARYCWSCGSDEAGLLFSNEPCHYRTKCLSFVVVSFQQSLYLI